MPTDSGASAAPDGLSTVVATTVRALELGLRPVRRAAAVVMRLPVLVVLGVVLVAQWLTVYAIGSMAPHNGPYYYTGGDATWYYTSAWVLGHGHIPQGSISYGYPFLLAPIAHFAGSNMLAGLPFVIALNLLVLWPIALLAVYGIAKAIGGRGFAYFASFAWTAFPLATIPYFYGRYHVRLVDQNFPSALGLIATGDFPSLVALLVAAYFTLRALSERKPQAALMAGAAIGLAVTIKPANLIFLPAPIAAFVIARRPRELLLASVGLVPALGGLALWKYRGLGYIPAFSSQASSVASGPLTPLPLASSPLHHYFHLDWGHLRDNMYFFREYAWSLRLITWALVAGVIGLAQRSATMAVLMGGWLTSYLVLKGTSPAVNVSDGSFFRYMEPAFPPFFFGLVAIVLLVPVFGRRIAAAGRRERFSDIGKRGWTALLGVAAVALVAPILALAAFTPLSKPDAAGVPVFDQYVPANAFSLTAHTLPSGEVVLAWPYQNAAGSHPEYAVFRESEDPLTCVPQSHNASVCSFSLINAGLNYIFPLTRTARAAFVDHPPVGKWIYRVVATISPNGPRRSGDYFLISRSLRVTERSY